MELFINMENKETNKTPLYKLKKFIERFKDIYNCIDLTLLVRYLFQVVEKQEERIQKIEDGNTGRQVVRHIEKMDNKKQHDELMSRLNYIEDFLTKKYGTKKESN